MSLTHSISKLTTSNSDEVGYWLIPSLAQRTLHVVRWFWSRDGRRRVRVTRRDISHVGGLSVLVFQNNDCGLTRYSPSPFSNNGSWSTLGEVTSSETRNTSAASLCS